jgi:hypothetical protein
VDEVPPGELTRFQAVSLEPPANATPVICTDRLEREYRQALADAETELRESYPGGGAELRIKSEMLYFQKKGLFSAAQFLTRVRFFEGDRALGDAMVVAESGAFTAGGESALAQAASKALVKHLRGGRTAKK